MNSFHKLSLLLTALTLTACANTPDGVSSQQQNNIKSCISEEATKLIGQKNLSETAIKAKTKASIVRVVAPDQPVTLDYRAERITVVTDPKTKIIVQASCG
ncbi:I78 family peptidase inhibitor [Acinetobacter schindleri]|uniref:I78 family peptidase inhibitor n=1 Tax=Acinetobacter schindleri TaxID=108981 RepID=UPI0035E3D3EC